MENWNLELKKICIAELGFDPAPLWEFKSPIKLANSDWRLYEELLKSKELTKRVDSDLEKIKAECNGDIIQESKRIAELISSYIVSDDGQKVIWKPYTKRYIIKLLTTADDKEMILGETYDKIRKKISQSEYDENTKKRVTENWQSKKNNDPWAMLEGSNSQPPVQTQQPVPVMAKTKILFQKMAAEWLEKPHHEDVEPYYLREFIWVDDPGAGYSFPSDEKGNVNISKLPDNAKASWGHVQKELAEGKIKDRGVIKISPRPYFVHGTIKCNKCGKPVEMYGDSSGEGIECENCGTLYNVLGQELAPRNQWEPSEMVEDY